jgi:hypothetical protein
MEISDMIGVAVERWDYTHRAWVCTWLTETFGERGKETWLLDQDYDLLTLCMTPEIYTLYKLKWE